MEKIIEHQAELILHLLESHAKTSLIIGSHIRKNMPQIAVDDDEKATDENPGMEVELDTPF